eukprot:scaffold10448_cov68-Phaeocystis_antarctica.AAC.10
MPPQQERGVCVQDVSCPGCWLVASASFSRSSAISMIGPPRNSSRPSVSTTHWCPNRSQDSVALGVSHAVLGVSHASVYPTPSRPAARSQSTAQLYLFTTGWV